MLDHKPNEIYELALEFINYTKDDIFLTGKAGTGKTTFLKSLKNHTKKKFLVVAPSSIAAVNAGGATIHSIFQLPPSMFIPEPENSSAPKINRRLNSQKLDLFHSLDLLVIDEVSMLRADVLDAIDLTLREARGFSEDSFGGIQLMYIGDLFQLPPVLNNQEKDIFYTYYSSPYFFSAKVIERSKPVLIELKEIYRQKDSGFINILNEVRNNSLSDASKIILNDRMLDASINDVDDIITITSHNSKADLINEQKLKKIEAQLHTFKGVTSGNFDERNFNVARELDLKRGAKVIFMKNDPSPEKKYYNGQIGVVHDISDKYIYVQLSSTLEIILLEKEIWQNTSFKVIDKKVVEEIVGEFQQYPIRLAYAITIHKSQGLTFDQAIIDAKDSFSPGQLYVALSRLRNLDGLYLSDALDKQTLLVDSKVTEFIAGCNSNNELSKILPDRVKDYLKSIIVDCFEWRSVIQSLDLLQRQFEHWKIKDRYDQEYIIENIRQNVNSQIEISEKFKSSLSKLLDGDMRASNVSERLNASTTYFTNFINSDAIQKIQNLIKSAILNKDQREFIEHCSKVEQAFKKKLSELASAKLIGQKLLSGFPHSDILDSLISFDPIEADNNNFKKSQVEVKIKKSHIKTLELFNQGLDVAAISKSRNLAITTIESHIAEFVLTGYINVLKVIRAEDLLKLQKLIGEEDDDLIELKVKVGNNVSFFELRCAINHCKYLKAGKSPLE
jgi:hypothetical protein